MGIAGIEHIAVGAELTIASIMRWQRQKLKKLRLRRTVENMKKEHQVVSKMTTIARHALQEIIVHQHRGWLRE